MAAVAAPLAGQPEVVWPRGLLKWIVTVDHKRIGIMYIATSVFFFAVGGIESLLIRTQLAVPQNDFLGPQAYNQVFTLHGVTMILFVVMPWLFGFANFLLPLMIGARDVAYPRLNALSLWMTVSSGLFLYYSLVGGGGPGLAWDAYAPLTEHSYATSNGDTYYALALIVTGLGTIATSINFIVTVIFHRAPGMGYNRLPVFVWMMVITSILSLFALPALT